MFLRSFLIYFSRYTQIYNKSKFEIFKILNIKKIINNILFFYSNYFQPVKVYNKPMHAIFEMSNKCTLKCPLCRTGGLKKYFDYINEGSMDFDIFKAGIDKLLPELERVTLYIYGEPFLNKDLFICINYAFRNKILTSISTNMMLYNEKIGRKLIESGLTEIIVSCDGLTQETYEKYRIGGNLSKLIQNVDNLISLKKKYNSKNPIIIMQFIIFKHNEYEIKEYERFWKSRDVDEISFLRMTYMTKYGEKEAKRLDLIPRNKKYLPFHPYGNVKKCLELYNCVTIDWNGDWYTCCHPSGEIDFRIGNIVTDNFWKVWNGEKYRYCRKLLKHKVDEKIYCETMCHDCTGIYPRNDTKKFWFFK